MDAKTMTMPNGDVINLKDDVARAKIGTGTLDTESKELIGAVNELKGTLTDLIVTQDFAFNGGSVGGGNRKDITIDATKSNYTLLGVIGVYFPYTAVFAINNFGISSNDIHISVYNTYNDARDATGYARAIYIHS